MCVIELEFRDENQRVAYHDTKQVMRKFKVLGKPVTSEHRSKTHKSPRCDFAENLLSEQARIAIQRLKHVKQVRRIQCGVFHPLLTTLKAKINKFIFGLKMVNYLEVYCDFRGLISTHINGKWMQNTKSAHQITVGGHQNSKIVYDVIKGNCRRLTSVYLGKVTMSVQTMDVTPSQLSMCISAAKMPSSQVTGIEMLRKQISLT